MRTARGEQCWSVTALPPEVRRAAEPVGVGGFEIGCVTDDGLEHRVSLSQAWATPFESCSPIRRFTSHKGQRHLSGLWWSATTGGHVGFESWMERDHVMALDFDPTVVGIASQPFWLSWRDDAGKLISHAPDFFARRADGTSVVVDCRPVGFCELQRRTGDGVPERKPVLPDRTPPLP